MRVVHLRDAEDAQAETREVVKQILGVMEMAFPECCKAAFGEKNGR